MRLSGIFALAVGVMLLPGVGRAALLDFTSTNAWKGNTTQNLTLGGVSLTVASAGGIMNSDTPPSQSACQSATGLACGNDGVGIGSNDDEITIGGTEKLTVTFGSVQEIAGLSFLDFFGINDDNITPNSPEKARVVFKGVGGGTLGDLTFTASTAVFPGLGNQAFAFAAIAGVKSIEFTALLPNNSDFALASIVTTPVPAAVLLFGSALMGLGTLRRRSAAPSAV